MQLKGEKPFNMPEDKSKPRRTSGLHFLVQFWLNDKNGFYVDED